MTKPKPQFERLAFVARALTGAVLALQRRARPILTKLVDRTGVNGHFAVLHGSDVLYLIEERAHGRPPLVTDVGVRLPAPLTASGLAILAALPPRQVRAIFPTRDAFVRRGERGPESLPDLKRLLVDTRARTYAGEPDTIRPGLASVARAPAPPGPRYRADADR